jgi:hypothetical protein
MSRFGAWGAGLSWSPQRLGRSLPIHRGLWLSRGVAAAVTLLAAGWAVYYGLKAVSPHVVPLGEEEAKQLVGQYLAKTQLPKWDPGPTLSQSERPAWEPFSPPPLWQGGPIGDSPLEGRALELAALGREDFGRGNFQAAATRLLSAAQSQSVWEVQYDAGLSLLAAGDAQRAAEKLAQAEAMLQVLADSGSSGPAFHAAQVATPYAAGIANLEFDCLEAIFRLRRAVRALKIYVEAGGALVYDRQLPFRVREAGIDNDAVWATLARAYDVCEGRFPSEYESRYERRQVFAEEEYAAADIPEIQKGPFPNSLGACISAEKQATSSRCWAYANLNKVAWGARSFFPGADDADVGRGLEKDLLPSLARLAYDIAWHAAGTEKDKEQAGTYLVYAARIDRAAKVGLAERIAKLGRHLAPLTKDYSPLAEPWRRHDLSSLTLDGDMKPEDLKGAAGALQERWVGHLRNSDPKLMMDEIGAQVGRSGPHGPSLQSWKEEVQARLRETLTTAMLTERSNSNLSEALAIREFEAPWLGQGWSSQAFRTWLTSKIWLHWAFLLLVGLLITAVVWLFHRLVVFPYLVYTADFYRLEHQRRHDERRRENKPFTRDEIKDAIGEES